VNLFRQNNNRSSALSNGSVSPRFFNQLEIRLGEEQRQVPHPKVVLSLLTHVNTSNPACSYAQQVALAVT
jgi:hypothetical protein